MNALFRFFVSFSQIKPLDDHKLLASSGTPADMEQFSQYIQKNMNFYTLENDLTLSTHATANYIRSTLATALRRGPFQTNVLLGGYDEDVGASLYFCDYLATLQEVNFGSHGHASNFILSIFDRDWREGMNQEEAVELANKCIDELHTRFLISQPNFIMKVVDEEGVHVL